MWVTVPAVLKPRLSWLAGCRLPLPETVDWTTPRATVAVRLTAVWLAGAGPTTRIAAAIAPAQQAPSPSSGQDGLRRSVIGARPRCWGEAVRRTEESP